LREAAWRNLLISALQHLIRSGVVALGENTRGSAKAASIAPLIFEIAGQRALVVASDVGWGELLICLSIKPDARFAACWNGGQRAGGTAFASGWVKKQTGELLLGSRSFILGTFFCRAASLREFAALEIEAITLPNRRGTDTRH